VRVSGDGLPKVAQNVSLPNLRWGIASIAGSRTKKKATITQECAEH